MMNENKFKTQVLPDYKSFAHLLREGTVLEDQQHILFVRHGNLIERYPLFGKQLLGRLHTHKSSDICIMSPFVSRDHGFFETMRNNTFYTAADATNGIYLNGDIVLPGEKVLLKDGDELTIPNRSYSEKENHIMLICAFSEYRINSWNFVMEAQFDMLTRLPNRKLFTEWFETEICKSGQNGLWLFILDIDEFKGINDTYGHYAGDEALKSLSCVLRQVIGNINYIGRWGGDEFVGVLKGDKPDAVKTLERISAKTASILIQNKFQISLSIGFCQTGMADEKNSLEDLLQCADRALYHAKNNGRNRIGFYENGNLELV